MEIETTTAVIAGLSIGIAFILTFALVFNFPANKQNNSAIANPEVLEPTYNVTLSIVGMRNMYQVGEPITFTLTVKGFGYYCQSPNAAIWNVGASGTSLSIWQSGLPYPYCNPPQPAHMVNGKYTWGLDRYVTIDKPGRYVLGARIAGDPVVQKEFTVIS